MAGRVPAILAHQRADDARVPRELPDVVRLHVRLSRLVDRGALDRANSFPSMNGWNFRDMAFLYGLWMVGHAIHNTFFSTVGDIPEHIRDGEFDRLLVRPLDPLFQADRDAGPSLPRRADPGAVHFRRRDLVQRASVDAAFVVFVPPIVVGGALIDLAFNLFISTVAFWFIRVDALRWIVLQLEQEFTRYPISIYSRGVRLLLTFVVPVRVHELLPGARFPAKADEGADLPAAVGLLTPLIGVAVLALAYAFWRFGLNRYQGVGDSPGRILALLRPIRRRSSLRCDPHVGRSGAVGGRGRWVAGSARRPARGARQLDRGERDRGVADHPHQQLALLGVEVDAADVVAVDDDRADPAVGEDRRGEGQRLVRERALDQPRLLAREAQRAARGADAADQLVAGGQAKPRSPAASSGSGRAGSCRRRAGSEMPPKDSLSACGASCSSAR